MKNETGEIKTIKDVLPAEYFFEPESKKYIDLEVLEEHELNNSKPWPGKEKNVNNWYVLENGKAIGWNENSQKGWSYPVIKFVLKYDRYPKLMDALKVAKNECKDPYALSYLHHVDDQIYHQYGNHGIAVQLLYCLNNMQSWKGEEAREIKKVLKMYSKILMNGESK